VSNIYLIITVVLIVLLVGVISDWIINRYRRSRELKDHFGPEYDYTVEKIGDEKKAQAELLERQRHVEALDIRPLTEIERERYLADWIAIQSKFIDEPGQAITDANRLIIEVMQVRDYPIEDFDQRVADISVSYPDLVGNYRAAQEIARKNEQHQADTEELRQAMVYYRSLFEELVGAETTFVEEKQK
jgi:hypothetical protein